MTARSVREEFLAHRAAQFAAKIRVRADELRALADKLDRMSRDAERVGRRAPTSRAATSQTDSYAWVAHDVQHAVANAVYGLVLHDLTTEAFDLDTLRLLPDA